MTVAERDRETLVGWLELASWGVEMLEGLYSEERKQTKFVSKKKNKEKEREKRKEKKKIIDLVADS